MPKKTTRNKKAGGGFASRTKRHSRKADSVKELLARTTPALRSLAAQASKHARWQAWLAAQLPPELMARVTGVVEREGELVIFTESASWGVRLRYVTAELQAQLRAAAPALERVVVRVMPKGAPM